eukprot:s265_g2.t1
MDSDGQWVQAKALKRKRRQKSLAQKAGQRMKDLRERLADAKAEVSKLKDSAQKKLVAAQKDYKKISASGDEFTHHGFAVRRTLDAAKDDLSKASAKLQRAMEEMNGAQERFGDAKAKATTAPGGEPSGSRGDGDTAVDVDAEAENLPEPVAQPGHPN